MTTKILFATVLAGMLSFVAPAAFADEGGHGDAGVNLGLHVGQLVSVRAHGQGHAEADGDKDDARATTTASSSTGFFDHVTAGIVTSVSGGIFTIDPFGPDSTTTVTTDASTTFRGKGHATSTAPLSVGSRVIVVGTTTATSTSGDTFTAAIVKILGHGFGHLRAFFGFGLR